MKFTRNQLVIIGIGVIFIVFIVLIFAGVIPGLKPTGSGSGTQQVKLTAWGIEDEKTFRSLSEGYVKIRSSVQIAYTKIPEANYETELLSALAAGRGPDIFMFHSSWLPKHFDKITPVPQNQYTLAQLKNPQTGFPMVAEQDFAMKGEIYALPLYIDTLALLYNKDILDAKAIALTPTTWQEFQGVIAKIRELNESNQIIKAAAAIGGSEQSISQASELLNNIMMQFGNPKISPYGDITFDNDGLAALNFYLQFANPASAYYTWNDNLSYSVDSLSSGKTAMIFNYAAAINTIKNKNPFLNLGIAPMPQLKGASQPVSQARYWGLAVSKQSRNPAWAWDFIINATTNQTLSEAYLAESNRPPALLTLIDKYLNNPNLNVFARQALIARSWPEPDSNAVRKIFSDMISAVLNGRLSSQQALSQTQSQVNSLRQK